MYAMSGGCTTLFHLFVEHPLLVFALGLAGFAAQVPSNPGPGDRLGTGAMLSHTEQRYADARPELVAHLEEMRAYFDTLHAEMTGDQIRKVMHFTDPCTEVLNSDASFSDRDVKEAAWLLYLDTYSRGGPGAARQLFISYPQKK